MFMVGEPELMERGVGEPLRGRRMVCPVCGSAVEVVGGRLRRLPVVLSAEEFEERLHEVIEHAEECGC
jgi:hypothetical protein